MRRRPGTLQNSECGTVPDQQCSISRFRAHAALHPGHEWQHPAPTQSIFAPTCLMMVSQCRESSATSLANSGGDSVTRSKLFFSKNSFDCGRSSTLPTSALIFAASSGGMLGGPNSPNHTEVL